MKKTKRSMLLSILCMIAVLILFTNAVRSINTSTEAEQAEILERSLMRSITACYSLEGAYPPDLAYLEEHYGLSYNRDEYFIDYHYIGSNLRPDITIIKKDTTTWYD